MVLRGELECQWMAQQVSVTYRRCRLLWRRGGWRRCRGAVIRSEQRSAGGLHGAFRGAVAATRCGRRRARRPRWVIWLRVVAHRAAATASERTRRWAFGRICGVARRLAHRVMSLQQRASRVSLRTHTGKDGRGTLEHGFTRRGEGGFVSAVCGAVGSPPPRPTNLLRMMVKGVRSAPSRTFTLMHTFML